VSTSATRAATCTPSFLKVGPGDVIEDVSYFTTGCGFGTATCSLLVELVRGKTVDAGRWRSPTPTSKLRWTAIPKEKDYPERSRFALQAAIEDYRKGRAEGRITDAMLEQARGIATAAAANQAGNGQTSQDVNAAPKSLNPPAWSRSNSTSRFVRTIAVASNRRVAAGSRQRRDRRRNRARNRSASSVRSRRSGSLGGARTARSGRACRPRPRLPASAWSADRARRWRAISTTRPTSSRSSRVTPASTTGSRAAARSWTP